MEPKYITILCIKICLPIIPNLTNREKDLIYKSGGWKNLGCYKLKVITKNI